MTKVSVIIPVCGKAEHLSECLQSLRCQTLKDIEILCVYGGEDQSCYREMLRQYMDEDERIYATGISAADCGKALNTGIEDAVGEYVGFMFPDDHASLDFYENCYRAAEENEADFVRTDFYRVSAEKTRDVKQIYCRISEDSEDYNKVIDPEENQKALYYLPDVGCGIYRKSFLREHDIRFHEASGDTIRDEGFFFQTCVFGKRAVLLDKAGYYRRDGESDCAAADPDKVYAADIEYDFIRDVLMDHPGVWGKVNRIYWKKRFIDTLAALDRTAPEFRKEYCRNMSRELNAAQKDRLIRYEDYGEKYWPQMQLILKDPDTFAVSTLGLVEIPKVEEDYVVNIRKLQQDSKRLQEVLNSTSYKLGFKLTSLPRRIKEHLKNR